MIDSYESCRNPASRVTGELFYVELKQAEIKIFIGVGGRHPFYHGRRAGRPRQQPGKVSGGILQRSHVRWLGKRRQRPQLSPDASGYDPQGLGFPMVFQGFWNFGSWQYIFKCIVL
ncbi:hypothetical protein TNCV_2746241 [Trichonephila clavipes]|nr:hypothetical protein TNCV_2746241 [Trichonephila clavipes]